MTIGKAMESITLAKLNSNSFEKIVRTLAIKQMGTAGTVFPMGPDGARDFSFKGKVQGYESQGWDGYLVLQAKFRSSPKGGSSDISWLTQQLDRELLKYQKPDSPTTTPKYYIIATNINLSGADSKDGKGKIKKSGLTKISEHLDTWKAKLGIEDFDIWSSEKIETLISLHPEIRTTYSAWLTPGDIIEKLLSNLSKNEEKLSYALKISLLHLLRRDKNVRLKDAGSVSDDQIRSSQVFIDLPTSVATASNRASNTFNFAAEIIERSKGLFCPTEDGSENLNIPKDPPNKYVLLGGPGQGKSTASLYLTQLFRASLLKEDSTLTIDNTTQQLINETLERAHEEGITNNLPPRYPFCISLPQFADKISEAITKKQKKPSILSFITDEISNISETDVSVADLRAWISSFPWIIILDGLDEVPPSGERTAVINAIHDFTSETQILKSDIIFLTTSRPQGYNSDLDPTQWTHWALQDLDPPKAISYAKLLAKAYYKDDPDRQIKIIQQLEQSISNPTTHRLMRSPLQVTILHMIVDTGGGIPTSRWNLFSEYFEILKKREKTKGGETQKILDKNSPHIGPIHQRCGLVLHIDAESAGQATSHLDKDRFSSLICGYLNSEDFTAADIKERIEELVELSLNRLVLLSSREEGKITFDVRSLQEFMAASALTASSHQIIESRLLHLAGKSHWQHVFTIAASRCFSEDNLHFMRSAITNIPRQLDTIPEHRIVGGGALLALELFSDGIAADQPKYRRLLAIHALELLNHGKDYSEIFLSTLYEPHTAQILSEEICKKYLNSQNDEVRAVTWNLINHLVENDTPFAIELIKTQWPTSNEQIFNIIKHGTIPHAKHINTALCADAITNTSFRKVLIEGQNLINSFSEIKSSPPDQESNDTNILNKLLSIYAPSKTKIFILEPDYPLSYVKIPLEGLSHVTHEKPTPTTNPEWLFIFKAIEFSKNPTQENLANCITEFSKLDIPEENKDTILRYTPWLLSTILQDYTIDYDLARLDILSDKYGTPDAWHSFEKELEENGLSREYLLTNLHPSYTFAPKNSEGICFRNTSMSHNNSKHKELTLELIEIAKKSHGNAKTNKTILNLIRFSGVCADKPLGYTQNEADLLISTLAELDPDFIYYEIFNSLSPEHWSQNNIKQLSLLSSKAKVLSEGTAVEVNESSPLPIEKLIAMVQLDEDNHGLLNLICIHSLIYKSCTYNIPQNFSKYLHNGITDSVKLSAATLLLLADELSIEAFVETYFLTLRNIDASNHNKNILHLLLENNAITKSDKIKIATSIYQKYEAQHKSLASKLKASLKKLLDSELSGLSSQETWSELSLPQDTYPVITPILKI